MSQGKDQFRSMHPDKFLDMDGFEIKEVEEESC